MRICKNCVTPMERVSSFSQEKNERFYRCPKCYSETKHRKLRDDELDFGEVLKKTMQKSIHRKRK